MTYRADVLFQQYFEVLKLHAYKKLRNAEDAEDAVMSVFAKVVQYQDTIADVAEIEPYLKRMVNNEISVIVRDKALNSEIPAISQVGVATPDDEVIASEARVILDRALDAVRPDHHREAATLYYKHDFGYSTIATMMGIEYQQAVSYIRQATSKVRCILQDKGYYD